MSKAEKAKEIQDKLQCNHCKGIFSGSLAQALRVVYEGRTTYCSEACIKAFKREKFSKPIPNRGACLGCDKEFFSRRDAKFCGMKCYTGSKQFSKMLEDARNNSMTPHAIAKRAESQRRGEGKPCLECGGNVYAKKSEKTKKYCSKICYRAYMAKRFDRQIANPDQMALPQGYDGFLDRSLLSCTVVGCDWQGHHLSVHMNTSHGIKADEFKRAAGFNNSTGVISRPLAEQLRARARVGVAQDPSFWGTQSFLPDGFVRRDSLEAKEHRAKARALCGAGPMRECTNCGSVFQQATPYGKAIYCTTTCRSMAYESKRKRSLNAQEKNT
jgi:hypothetical protein